MVLKYSKRPILRTATAALLITGSFAGTNVWGAAWGSPAIDPVNAKDCIILVEDQAILKGRFSIPGDPNGDPSAGLTPAPLRSDVCAGNKIVAGGAGTTQIPQGGGGQQDAALIAPNIQISTHGNVAEVVYDGAGGSLTVGSSPTITPPIIENPNLNPANIPSVTPLAPIASSPTNHQSVPNNGTLTLTPGTYGKLSVGRYGVLNLEGPGTYIFEHIATTQTCTINPLAPDITLLVRDFAFFAEFCRVNEAQMERFEILVGGEDGSYGGANKNRTGVYGKKAAFGYDGDGAFFACLVQVPLGTINMRGIMGSQNKPGGARFAGMSFQQIQALSIDLENPQELCGIDPQCACIDSIACDENGFVTVYGKGLTNTGVKDLAVYTESANVAVGGAAGDAGSDQPASELNFIDPSKLTTVNDLAAEIDAKKGPGLYYLGIIGPQTLNGVSSSFCVYTGQLLEVTAGGGCAVKGDQP
jgi:hypothetical protein